jgi:hypothetical protein
MEIDVPGMLVSLLFVRSAWKIDGPPGLPRTSPPPDPGTTNRPDSPGLDAAWTALWRRGIQGEPMTEDSWLAVLGVEEIDQDARRAWSNTTRQRINTDVVGQGRPLRQTSLPHRATSGEAAGVSSVVIVPVEGWYAERVTPARLVLSEAAYTDDDAWAAALAVG